MPIRSGPHSTIIGNRELRHRLTAPRSATDQDAGAPSGLAAQSYAAVAAPMSVPAATAASHAS